MQKIHVCEHAVARVRMTLKPNTISIAAKNATQPTPNRCEANQGQQLSNPGTKRPHPIACSYTPGRLWGIRARRTSWFHGDMRCQGVHQCTAGNTPPAGHPTRRVDDATLVSASSSA